MPRKKVRPFDFSKLKKLSRAYNDLTLALLEQYPQLSETEGMGRTLLETLAKDLNLSLTLNYVGMEEIDYGQFIHSLPSLCVAVQLQAEPQEGKVVLDIDYSLSRMLIDKLLGGSGNPPQELIPLSPIEEGVLEFLVLKVLNQLKEVPGMTGPSSLKMVKVVQEGKMLSDGSAHDELGVVFKFFLGLRKKGGYLRVYFPHPLIEGLFLREDALEGVVRSGEETLIEERLNRASHVKTSLWSEVGRADLLSSEKEQLEKGDVILFDETFASMGPHGLAGKAILRVGENPNEGLLAEVVDSEGKLVLKILDFYGGE